MLNEEDKRMKKKLEKKYNKKLSDKQFLRIKDFAKNIFTNSKTTFINEQTDENKQ